MQEIPYLGYVITREGIKPDKNKFQGVMNIGQPTTNKEAQAIIGIVQYYRYMWPMQSHILAPLPVVASGPKGRKILCNDTLESYFTRPKCMVSAETL